MWSLQLKGTVTFNVYIHVVLKVWSVTCSQITRIQFVLQEKQGHGFSYCSEYFQHEFTCCSKYHSMRFLVALITICMNFLVALHESICGSKA